MSAPGSPTRIRQRPTYTPRLDTRENILARERMLRTDLQQRFNEIDVLFEGLANAERIIQEHPLMRPRYDIIKRNFNYELRRIDPNLMKRYINERAVDKAVKAVLERQLDEFPANNEIVSFAPGEMTHQIQSRVSRIPRNIAPLVQSDDVSMEGGKAPPEEEGTQPRGFRGIQPPPNLHQAVQQIEQEYQNYLDTLTPEQRAIVETDNQYRNVLNERDVYAPISSEMISTYRNVLSAQFALGEVANQEDYYSPQRYFNLVARIFTPEQIQEAMPNLYQTYGHLLQQQEQPIDRSETPTLPDILIPLQGVDIPTLQSYIELKDGYNSVGMILDEYNDMSNDLPMKRVLQLFFESLQRDGIYNKLVNNTFADEEEQENLIDLAKLKLEEEIERSFGRNAVNALRNLTVEDIEPLIEYLD